MRRTGAARTSRAGRGSSRSSRAASAGADRRRGRREAGRGASPAARESARGDSTAAREAASSIARAGCRARRTARRRPGSGRRRRGPRTGRRRRRSASVGTGYSRSPRTRSRSRLVTSTRRFGQRSTSVASSGPTDEDLLEVVDQRAASGAHRCAPPASPRAPRVCSTAWITSSGLAERGASPRTRRPGIGRRAVPPPRSRGGSCPVPPGPVRVSSRAPPRQAHRSPRPRAPARRRSRPVAAGSCSRSCGAAGTHRCRAGRSRPASRSP